MPAGPACRRTSSVRSAPRRRRRCRCRPRFPRWHATSRGWCSRRSRSAPAGRAQGRLDRSSGRYEAIAVAFACTRIVPAQPAGEIDHLAFELRDIAQYQPGVMQQRRSGGGREHAGRLALEKLDVEVELEVGQPLADRRGRKMHAIGRLGEAGLLDHGDEQPKRDQVDACRNGFLPLISRGQHRRWAEARQRGRRGSLRRLAQAGSPIGNGTAAPASTTVRTRTVRPAAQDAVWMAPAIGRREEEMIINRRSFVRRQHRRRRQRGARRAAPSEPSSPTSSDTARPPSIRSTSA